MPADSELLERWRGGESRAGQELFARYFDAVSRFFANKVTSDCEDLVQDTFMACLKGRDVVRDDDRFRSYLFGVAYNILRGYYRKRYRGPDIDALESQAGCDLAPGPSSMLHANEHERLLHEALRAIPLEFQVALELHYWQELTTSQIAAALDVPAATVKSRLRRGRGHLERVLTETLPDARARDGMLAALERGRRS